MGTNELVGTDPKKLKPYLEKLMAGEWKKGGRIPLWDGKTAERKPLTPEGGILLEEFRIHSGFDS